MEFTAFHIPPKLLPRQKDSRRSYFSAVGEAPFSVQAYRANYRERGTEKAIDFSRKILSCPIIMAPISDAVFLRRNNQIQDAIDGQNLKQALQLIEKRMKKGEDTRFLKVCGLP